MSATWSSVLTCSDVSSYACRKFGDEGLPDHSINVKLSGSAGQSFCAFMPKGVHVTLEGDANDYVGKVCAQFTLNFLVTGSQINYTVLERKRINHVTCLLFKF